MSKVLNTPARRALAVRQREKELLEQRARETEEARRLQATSELAERFISALGGAGVGADRWRMIQQDTGLAVEYVVTGLDGTEPTAAARFIDEDSNREITVSYAEAAHEEETARWAFGSHVLEPRRLWDAFLAWVADVRGLEPLASEAIEPKAIEGGADVEGAARRVTQQMRDRFDACVDPAYGVDRTVSPGAEGSALVVRSKMPLAPEAEDPQTSC